MTTPLFEREGTWEEIITQFPDFSGQKLHVLVYPVTEEQAATIENRPLVEVLAEIAAALPAEELTHLPADFADQLDHYIYGTPKR